MSDAGIIRLPLAVLDGALLAHQAVPLHAHEQAARTADHLYQDHGALMQRMDTPEWQVIYGARGSGKTAALRTYAERTRRGGLQHRDVGDLLSTVAVYLDAKKFQPPYRAVDDRARAEAAFRLFLNRFGDALIATTQAMGGRQSIWPSLRNRNRKQTQDAHIAVRDILAVVDRAQPTFPYDSSTVTTEESEQRTHEREGHVKGSASASTRSAPSIALDLGAGSTGEHHRSTTTTRVTTGEGHPVWPRIGDMLEQLCTAIGVDRIDILIDNWTALDADGTGVVQPHFADFLAQALLGSDKIAVKIAADGLQTVFWNRALGIGLEPDRQIVEVENLGHALLDDYALVSFFEQLLFRRMLKDTDELRAYVDPSRPGNIISPSFVLAFFERREAFELLVHGTEGRPRLFLHCVRDLAHRSNFSVRVPFTQDQVLEVVRRRPSTDLDDLQYYSDAVVRLLVKIKPRVAANGDPHFALGIDQARRHEPLLRELRDKRLIMRAPEVEQPAAEDLGKVMFKVSDALMADWERALRFQQRVEVAQNQGPTVPVALSGRIEGLTVDLDVAPGDLLDDVE